MLVVILLVVGWMFLSGVFTSILEYGSGPVDLDLIVRPQAGLFLPERVTLSDAMLADENWSS